MIVLDTNVVSELMRAAPADAVVAWLAGRSDADLCTTAITFAEVRHGIARLPAGRRRARLTELADDVFTTYGDRLLPFDRRAALAYGPVLVERERAGRPISALDAQIAAICRAHRAALATRDAAGFAGLGLEVADPWTDAPPV